MITHLEPDILECEVNWALESINTNKASGGDGMRFVTLYRRRIKTIPMEKKCKKSKWLSGEALQIPVKRREAKNKGEKERYKHLNAEFQRIAKKR